jgi:hypothetical protein
MNANRKRRGMLKDISTKLVASILPMVDFCKENVSVMCVL